MSNLITPHQTTGLVLTATTVNGHALSSNVTVTASDVGLGSVTNDVQTKAAIVPNTAPSAGQVLVGNASNTAYAKQSLSSDASLSAAGAVTVKGINGTLLSGLATGILKNTTTTGVPSIATAGVDYQVPLTNPVTGTGTSGQIAQFNGTTTLTSSNTLPSTTVATTQATGDWDTSVATTAFVKNVQTLKPVFGVWYAADDNYWYELGYVDPTAGEDIGTAKIQYNALRVTDGATSQTQFGIVKATSGTANYTYTIDSGNVSAIRSNFRVYLDGSLYRIYVRLVNGTMFDYMKWFNLCHNFTEEVTYAGNGTDPTGVSGYTKLYDTAVDEAGIIAPKSVAFASGAFASSPQSANIYFSHGEDDNFSMTLSQLLASGSTTSDVITAPAGTIPDKYMPYGYATANMPHFPIETLENSSVAWGSLHINTSLDGGFTIYRPGGANFVPANSTVGFYNTTVTWTIKNA
jgi:hypothetical protein